MFNEDGKDLAAWVVILIFVVTCFAVAFNTTGALQLFGAIFSGIISLIALTWAINRLFWTK